jgi:transmembrane sensor
METKYLQYSISELAQDEAFIRWVKQPDALSHKKWQDWLSRHPEAKEKVDAAASIVRSLSFVETPVSDAQKDALWSRIDALTTEEAAERRPGTRLRTLLPYLAAAMLALAISFYFIFAFQQPTTLSTAAAESLIYDLPDGSTVTLNAGSTVSFHKRTWAKNRAIQLEGEAFFEVKKGSPFTVSTHAGSVEVLGTSFNVDSYDEAFSVACYTGKVKVKSPAGTATLTAGQKVRANLQGLANEEFDPNAQQDWRKGYFKYVDEPSTKYPGRAGTTVCCKHQLSGTG